MIPGRTEVGGKLRGEQDRIDRLHIMTGVNRNNGIITTKV